jgi:hypothetical protein
MELLARADLKRKAFSQNNKSIYSPRSWKRFVRPATIPGKITKPVSKAPEMTSATLLNQPLPDCSQAKMKFSFKPNYQIADNIRQIAALQLLLARKHLTYPPGGDMHEGNHETRKCFKRLRGLLRMARPALAEREFQTLLRDRQDSLYCDSLKSGASLLKKRPKKIRKKIQKRLHLNLT